MTHLSEEDLVLIYYGEPEVSGDAAAHLAGCAACRAAADSLAQTLDACSEWVTPEVDPRRVWARVASALEPRRWWTPVFEVRFWLAAGAVATLAIAAFFAGRSSLHPAPAITAGLSAHARERILAISLADHLGRAELLLTEVANMTGADPSELAAKRVRAKDLVHEGRLMRQMLSAQQEETSGMLPVFDEVGRFVLEVANAPDQADLAEIQRLQWRIDAESLLFKVRIIESNLRMQNSNTSGKMS
jgi:hypothetical protein